MQTLPSKGGPDSGIQKFIQYLPLIAGAIAVFWFWGSVSQFVVRTLEDTIKTAIYGGALLFVLGIYWANKTVFSMWYKTLCKKIAGLLIKMDPLSYMDRYADDLVQKLNKLRKIKVRIQGRKNDLERQIEEEKVAMTKNLKLAQAAVQQKKDMQAQAFAQEANGNKESIQLFTPSLERMNKTLDFLRKVDENWDLSITGVRSFNKRKRIQYKTMKENAEALGLATEFLKGETPERQAYDQSIQIAEEQMAGWKAFADDFEERAQPILAGAAIEKQMGENEGMKLLEEFMRGDKLLIDLQKIEEPEFQVVSSQVGKSASGGSKYNFVK